MKFGVRVRLAHRVSAWLRRVADWIDDADAEVGHAGLMPTALTFNELPFDALRITASASQLRTAAAGWDAERARYPDGLA